MAIPAAPGELVAVELAPGPRWAEVLGELWAAGAPVLPLDLRTTQRERRRIVELARPALLVTEDEEIAFADPAPVDERIAAVVATSGTGGAPRLAELSRAALVAALEGSAAALAPTDVDRWVACLTPAHVGGLLVLLRGVVLGAPLEVHATFDPARIVGAAPCWASVVPTMVRRLLAGDPPLVGLSLLVGGGALDPQLRARAEGRGARVVSTYGLTESCGGVVYDGIPFAGTRVRIGTDGEIELAGPTLMEGYRHDPQATASAFTLDGWLRTGDVGSLEDGRLVVHGRIDDVIRTGGEKVWPEEVEAVLREHPAVADAAVAGRPDAHWGEHVAAWVVPARVDEPPSLEELRAACRERLAPFKAPKELFLVTDIPRTASGKIRRRDLEPA
ncbi:MAG: O-succinylbenzoic acid--CoA ligase [Actinomycetota bacterium]|nr:MAG: O-succinylbenzoic acid--CoA ligase [Actinomycetota bacterium]